MATFSGPGKGRKKCANCGIYVGVRTTKCECGHDFVENIKVALVASEKVDSPKKENTPKRVDPQIYHSRSNDAVILVPAGNCPVKLHDKTREAVVRWIETLVEKRNYAVSALKYYVRQFYDIHGAEFRDICDVIDDLSEELCLPNG